MPLNFRRTSAAFLAMATGGVAGWVVNNSFGLPQEAMFFLLDKPLGGVFRALSSYSYGQVALVSFLYHLPMVVGVGLFLGLIQSRSQYPRLLIYSIFAWPIYYFVEHLLLIKLVWSGRVAWAFLDKLRSEVSVFCVEYLLVIVVVFLTNAWVLRAKRHNLPLQWTRDEAARL